MNAREALYYGLTTGLRPVFARRWARKSLGLFNLGLASRGLLDPGMRHWLRKKGPWVYAATVIVLFGVNAVWALAGGRFAPDVVEGTRTFGEDWANWINYLLVCPLYVTFGICFILHSFELRECLAANGFFPLVGIRPSDRPGRRAALITAALVILVASGVTVTLFTRELSNYDFTFWFQVKGAGGTKELNGQGIYYVITNGALNLVAVTIVAAHVEFLSVAAEIGHQLRSYEPEHTQPPKALLSKDDVVAYLHPFTSLYVVSKILVMAFLLNMYTWKVDAPGIVGMIDLTILLLGILAAAVVSYPRYHVQHALYQVWRAHGKDEYPEVRRPVAVGLANLADLVILGGAMTNLLVYVAHKSNVDVRLFDFKWPF
jgi:hypothetical protein